MILGWSRHNRELSAPDRLLIAPLIEIHKVFF